MGPTGLKDGSTDIEEDAGCNTPGKDNFLKPLDMVAGKSYALVINNFSSTNNGFAINFGGTGTFLVTDPCYVAIEEVQESGPGGVILYPNPASNKIYLQVDKEGLYTLTIYNMQGLKAFEEGGYSGKEFTADIFSLPSGYYYCVLKEKGGEFITKKFAVMR
jgi:hypothetical protein